MKTEPNAPIHGNEAFNGLTKREHFAAMAMQSRIMVYGGSASTNIIAELAVKDADALIHALNTTEK